LCAQFTRDLFAIAKFLVPYKYDECALHLTESGASAGGAESTSSTTNQQQHALEDCPP